MKNILRNHLSVLSFMFILFMLSCNPGEQKQFIEGEAQGTWYHITFFDDEKRDLKPGIDSLLKSIDKSVSLWDDSSVLSRVNRNDSLAEADAIFRHLFETACEIARITGGKFNPAIGPVVSAWGFHRKRGNLPDSAQLASLLKHIDYNGVILKNNRIVKQDTALKLDFNAHAQGYSADLIGEFLRMKGITRFLVEIGGEVLAGDGKPDGSAWVVGIEKPAAHAADESQVKIMAGITGVALATSGNYRNYREEGGKRFSHTIDPSTGYPVTHNTLSVSVMAKDALTADAYATAFMVMGAQGAWNFIRQNKNLGLEAYFILEGVNGELSTIMTPGFSKVILSD